MIQRKRVNLLTKSSKKKSILLFGGKLPLVGAVIGITMFIALLILIVLFIFDKQAVNNLVRERQELENYILNQKDNEAKITYFSLKKDQLKKFMEEDARFLPYYRVLNDVLTASSNSANVENLLIDKTRKTSFLVNLEGYDSMYKFIKYIETPEFLSNFEELKLLNFTLDTEKRGSKKQYQLNFEGKFKPLYELTK